MQTWQDHLNVSEL